MDKVNEYNFAYEIRRYEESLRKPLRTYRVEFNLGGPTADSPSTTTTTEVYTTYSAPRLRSSETSTLKSSISYDKPDFGLIRDGDSPTRKIAKTDFDAEILRQDESVKFTEIRSLKRVDRTNESVGTADIILNTPGIRDYTTGRILTVGEAIQMRILDVRTGEILVNENGERISLESAAQQKIIDPKLVSSLLNIEDNSGQSLLERIQNEILVAENGFMTTSSTKTTSMVTSMTTSMTPSLTDEDRIKVTKSSQATTKTIAEAINEGLVDHATGLYRLPNGEFITINEAYELGYLIRHETVKIKSNALCLTDAIAHGLVDTSGWVTDRNSGDKFRLDSAINNSLINPEVREVVDTRNDVKITVEEALKSGVLNPKTGRYLNHVTKEKLTFAEAKNRQLIVKPMTLKDVVDRKLIDENAKIVSPTRRSKLTIVEAMNVGVLDSDHIKSVTKVKGELLTLAEALGEAVVLPEGRYRDVNTNELVTIPEAVDRGLISSVSQKSIFDIDGFRDPFSEEFVSLNLGLSKNIVIPKGNKFVIDGGNGVGLISLQEGVEGGLVRPEVCEMLNRRIGMFKSQNQELTVLELVLYDLIDPKSGYLLDPEDNRAIIPLDTAIERKIITPEGALLLSSLLNITLTTETVTKTVKRYVTVTGTENYETASNVIESQETTSSVKIITFTDAVHSGLLDEQTQTFQDPATGNIYSVQEALNYGLIAPDSDVTTMHTKPTKTTIKIVKKSFLPDEIVASSSPIPLERRTFTKESTTEIQHSTQTTERQILELPPEGWLLEDAIRQKLLDPVTGLLMIPGTDRLVSFEECVRLKIIHPDSAVVIDPRNLRKVTLTRSLDKSILDPTGRYEKTKSLKDAISDGKVIFQNPADVNTANSRLIQITKIVGQPDVVEVSNLLNDSAPTFTEVKIEKTKRPSLTSASSIELPSPEPVQLTPGAIYDPTTALVIFTETGESLDIITAARLNKLPADLGKIVDPNTGQEISLKEGIERGIINPETGEILDRSGKRISLIQAIKMGALTVVGAPLVAAASAIHSLKMVFDPNTGEQIPYELAVERGLVKDEVDLTPTIFVQDPKTGMELSLHEAVQSGLVSPDEATSIANRAETVQIVSDGRSEGELTKSRITFEPKYKVAIGRAKSIPSPDREAKPVVLQKMRKKIVRPKDAVEKGIIDKQTGDLLEARDTFMSDKGEPLTLEDSVAQKKINPEKGSILDSQRGDIVNIKGAMERGILDPEGTNQILLPIAKSLSIPQLKDQALLDPATAKIVHPETGALLSLREAIVCDIVDPLSGVIDPHSGVVTPLEEAIKNNLIDDENSQIKTGPNQKLNLLEGIEQKYFPHEQTATDLPLVGLTFPVAVKRGLVDSTTKQLIHPITGVRQKIKDAVENNFIMALPYTPNPNGVEVNDAIKSNLIDFKMSTFKIPETSETITLSEAVETGHLIIKPLSELVPLHSSGPITSVTETVTSYHTITTKTIELLTGYSLVSSDEVRNLHTGEILPLEEAKKLGIVKDESETKEKFATREIKISFSEALKRGLLDIAAGTYTDPSSGNVMPISQAVSDGILETVTEETITKTTVGETDKMSIVDACDNLFDQESQLFHDPNTPGRLVELKDAIDEGIVDGNQIVYDVNTGKAQSLEAGIRTGVIDPKTGEFIKGDGQKSMSIKEAAKMGLLAVVGAPILAGIAAKDAIKDALQSRKSDELHQKSIEHVQFAEPLSQPSTFDYTKDLVTISMRDAIAQKKIDPMKCRLMFEGQELPFNIQTGVRTGKLNPDDFIQIVSPTQVLLMNSPTYELELANLTPEVLASLDLYNAEYDIFIDPKTGEKITFQQFIYETNILDPDTIFVKDQSANTYEHLEVAFERPLIDRQTGHMVDIKTGKRISFFECIRREWIIQRLHDALTEDSVLEPPPKSQSLETIVEAIDSGVVNAAVRNPVTGEIVPMRVAIENKLVDLTRGVLVNPATNEEMPLKNAYEQGLLLSGNPKPISLEAIVKKELFDPTSKKIQNPQTKEFIHLEDAVISGIIDPKISKIKDTKRNQRVTLTDALASDLIDGKTGDIRDGLKNRVVPLHDAVKQGLITTDPVSWSLIQALSKEYYNPKTGCILNPITGNEDTLSTAIQSEFIHLESVLIRNEPDDKIVTAEEAVQSGLLEPLQGIITRPEMTLDEAYLKGYVLSAVKPVPLTDAIARGLYDPATGLLRIDGVDVTLDNAIKAGEISVNELIIKNPKTGNLLSLDDGIRQGLINSKMGLSIDPWSGQKSTLTDAMESGMLIPSKRRTSLPDAVFKGLYDPKSGQFSSQIAPEKLSTSRAIRRGLIDPQSTIVNVNNKILPFELAVETGVIDGKRGTVLDDTGSKIDFREAFDRGILIEVHKPIGLAESILKKIYHEPSGLFMNPQSGKLLSLQECLEQHLIDPDSVQFKDLKTGLYKSIPLSNAIEMSLISGKTSEVTVTGEAITLKRAFELGYISDSKAPISIQRAIHQGLYDEKTGKIFDPSTGRKITVHEAIRKFLVNPQLPCYFNEREERLLSLSETCRQRLIDRREGLFHEPGSDSFIPLSEAMGVGLIVDIESAGFGLYELLAMGLYDESKGLCVHPVTNRKISLRTALAEDLVSPLCSLVKNSATGKYMILQEAIDSGIIDDEAGVYTNPRMNLQDARRKGLIVTNKKLLSMEIALRNHLYRAENGKFANPSTGEYLNLKDSIDSGLIDPDSTVFKDPSNGDTKSLKLSIEAGDIDIPKGRVLDSKSKRSYNYDVAFERGLLLTVDTVVYNRSIIKKEVADVLDATQKSPRDMSVDEAIRYEIINPETAVIKDPNTNKFRPLKLAIAEDAVDLNLRTIVDSKSLFFVFDPTCVIYAREPLSFDDAIESNRLDLNTGKFTQPTSATSDGTAEEPQIYTLKEALSHGFVDPETVLIKDGAKKKLYKLTEAYRKGLVDSDKANVLDTTTSKMNSLPQAIECGLLITPKRSLALLEALTYNLYNPTTGGFIDPFATPTAILNRKRITLADAIASGLIDPSSTMVRDSANSTIVPLQSAISTQLVDPVEGRLIEHETKVPIDFCKAFDKGLLLPAEQRQAVKEKFALCEDNLAVLLKWIISVEQKISSNGGPRERNDELRNQINALKAIKDDIDSQSRPVASCLEQVRQIVLTGGEVLSAPEVAALENSGRELKSRVERAQDRTIRLLKRLNAARDELSKLISELEVFSSWLQQSRRTLEDKERLLSDLSRLSSQGDSIREFVSDVIAHQADLRFIAMSAQKFGDESKEYLTILNEFRTTLPERLPHIEPAASSESPVRQEVQLVQAQYRDLLHRANALSDKMSGLGGKQREYQDALEKVQKWLKEVQPKVASCLSDPIAADPQAVQDQMNQAKGLHNEFLNQGRLVDNVEQSLNNLLRQLAGQLNPGEVSSLEIPVEEVKDKYSQLFEALKDRCKELDTALVQSQGVQDALDSLVGWMNQAEDKFKVQFRPASLIKERLMEQIREHRSLIADLESHRESIDSVAQSAGVLIQNASNARIAKRIESKLNDVSNRYDKLYDKASKRGELLDLTLGQLNKFNEESTQIEKELGSLQERLDNRELTTLPAEELAIRMQNMTHVKEQIRPIYEECVRLGKDLVGQRDVTDTGPVRDRVKALENLWKTLDTALDEKTKLSKQRAEQLSAYDNLRDQVQNWLQRIETRVVNLAPVSVDLDIIAHQVEELKPLVKEHRDYATNIEKINDVGNAYDALTRPDSPTRKRSTYSPVKRSSVVSSLTHRSPSPTKSMHFGPSPIISPLSPGGSSGFGSRRSSQDGFQLTELSPVQQQLNEINNRYGLVGVKLNDRQNELDAVRDEMKKHQDSLKTLSQFLDKIQRQVPKDTIGTKDEAERCTKQARKVLEDMYEKQSLLDSTKAQVRDLLKRKPDVQGAEKLRIDLENVSDRWKTLNDLCKDRINFSEQLRDFLDTHDNLNGWLASKEKMLTVLGPISSDPRMVQSQVQQVQVLREEFRGQQPQLNHLNEVGHSILDNVKPTSPEGQAINGKLKAVQKKWDDLIGRLDERADSLGAAADTSKEFDAGLNRLREALQTISDNLDALPTDRDFQDNLRKIENLERQLEGQRPLLADAEQSAQALCNVLGDPASRADVNSRVSALGKQYGTLQKKLDNRKAETEAALRDGRQFAESCAKTLGWLASELAALNDRLLVSAHRPTLQHQVDTHEPVYREIMAREHEVIMLLNKGRDLTSKPGNQNLQKDLDKISQQWDRLRRDASDRHSRLQTCLEHCRKYYLSSETFLSWLRTAEDKLASLKPGVLKKSQLDQQLKELQSFRSEVWKRSGEYEGTRGLGETFVTACDTDKEPVKAELLDLKERWEKLNNDLLNRAQTLEACAKRLADFNDELRDLDNSVGRCEDRLGTHDALGGAAKDPKLLDRVKAIKDETDALRKPLQAIKKLADDIGSETRAAGGDAEHLRGEVDAIADRIEDLQNRLNDRCGELQSAATAVSQFQEQVRGFALDLYDLENEVDGLPAPAREVRVVLNQIDNIVRLLDKIDGATENISELERAGDRLLDAGFATDTHQTREQIAGLRKILLRLENRSKDHEDALQQTLKQLQEFYAEHTEIMDDLKNLSDELRKLKPVGSELDQIRNQQEEFRRFQTRHVEPLAGKVDEVNRAGQDLVRSAQGGVSTSVLEKDLERLMEIWNQMKEKMNERERRLDVALLQSGKFQEALDGLAKWLSDTEEMVANQKPPSAEYQVVKAQLQEQKFLKKMLLDRQNSMSSLFALGQEVAANCDPTEKARIEKQLKELMGRFDNLTEGAQTRTLDLEQAMHVAKQFQDKLVPLTKWLDGTEKLVKTMELVPTDEEKIQQRIHEHEALHDEIISKQPDFSELTDIAGQLMALVGDDEGVALGDKVKGITDRYTNLVEASDSVGHLLLESRQGLRHLVLTYQELVGWMEAMENRLARYKIIPVHTEKLLEQMDILVELNQDIANRAPNVESTVETGAELMKHITSDEALQLKDKLDSLQRRYGELTTRGGDLLNKSQTALPLVQNFHKAHSRLLDWMQEAESILTTGDPRETEILRLHSDLTEMRPVLETVNLVGPQLCQISPGEGAATIESLVTRDNRRFDAIVEQIQRKTERLHLSKQRSKEITADLDELLEWFRDMDASLRDADQPSMEPDTVRLQLQEHKSINDDIASQKGRVRDVTNAARKILRESQPNDDAMHLREKLEDLKEVTETVTGLCSERLSILEQALPLSEHFADSHSGLSSWLDEMEHQISLLSTPALRPDQIASQQDKNERLTQSIVEHKPLLDKLNKTGEALAALVCDDDTIKIHDILNQDNGRYVALRTELRERQLALEQALQESSQFSDKLEGMLRALSNTVEQIKQAEPISAHPPKIEEQIDDNAALTDDINKRGEAFAAVQRAANDVIAKAGNKSDPAVRDIKKKLEKLNEIWNEVQNATKKRGAKLEDVLKVAEKFWKELQAILDTLKDLEETLTSQEPPAAQPQAIQKQQVALQEIRHEIDQTKPEVEEVRRTGNNLMSLCGEPDKPEVKKHIEDLDNAWDNITALYAKREENLIDAMEKAMEFHETLQNLLKFLEKAEDRFTKLGPVGSDIDAVKRQIEQLKDFKDDVDPHMVEIEALNRQAVELTERTSPEQAAAIREPLNSVNRRWENLLRGLVDRQKQLEHALLHLGQFQHALNELLVWISKTDHTLDQLKPIPGDPQLLEIELAKLKVLANDIQAHQSSVDTLNDAGRQLIETDKGSIEASTTQEKLYTLNKQWRDLVQKSSDRQHELEESLREAHAFMGEVQDLLGWLGDVDSVIGSSKPVGGLPETATEQLERFMEIYKEIEENHIKVDTLLAQGQEYIKKQTQLKVPSSNLQHALRALKQRWDAVLSRANDKKIKLEIALREATEFHDALQAFVEWLTAAEKQLASTPAVSRVLETIQQQIEEHKILQKDVSIHREAMLLLDKKGTHLKYFSQKQDVILIKNLLVSVQHRWERVVAKAAERTRALDHGYKEAREFHDTWSSLMQWLQETENNLDQLADDATSSNVPEKIKRHLEKIRETQRLLSGKQGQYDNTMRNGKNLIDRAPKTDESHLNRMVHDLKEHWTRVCQKSVDRQRKLEEALLLSGQFSEALQALLDWLKKAKSRLSEQGPVHGDLDTVTQLVDQHKHLESDLQKRAQQMHQVLKTGRDLERSGDAKDISKNLNELQNLWDDVTTLSSKRGSRLQEALREAERLHKSVNMLLEWLSEAEQRLRFASSTPEDEHHAKLLLDEHEKFMRDLREKEHDKDDTIHLAQSILEKAHPEAVPIIKNWITIIQSRWEEVSQWAISRHTKLSSHMQTLKDLDESIEELLAWLSGLEATLLNLEKEPLPEEIPPVQQLIQDHTEFMENTARRQLEVDRACKPKQLPPGTKDRKVSRGNPKTKGSVHDLRENSPDYGTLGRKQSFKGSRDQGLNSRKTSRISPGRDHTPEKERLPHYGPRFPPSQAEAEFRSPNARLLWDKWRYVWMLAWERQRRLHDHLLYLQDLERVRQFSWDEWRKRFLKFMNHKKSRLTDLFRKMDKDNNGLIPREIFMDGIINTKFDTSRLEMGAVADLFDRNNEGLIDWQEFIAALRPDWQERKPDTDADKIHDEVKRLVMLCTCRQKFRVFQVGEGKYRFGDSQKLRLVRILRSTVMVRVGGGWIALDEFLVKNDPCRAKGRTNIELREQFILADGVSQSMAAFKTRYSGGGSQSSSPSIPSQGPITKVRERSQRSVAMSRPTRSSHSASTPDSLSDNESSLGVGGKYTTPRKTSLHTRTGLTPGASRGNSKPNSRPVSRAGSKPPSRQGSSLSLDSTDNDGSRLPVRTPTSSTTTPRPSRLAVGGSAIGSGLRTNGVKTRTPSGSASPAPSSGFKSKIPVKKISYEYKRTSNSNCNNTNNNQSSSSQSNEASSMADADVSLGRNTSGTSTPSGMQTPRRSSAEPQPPTPGSLPRKGRGTTPTPIDQRAPFRL